MPARVIVISNRVAVPAEGKSSAAGGLSVAVKAALKRRSGMWFGWSGETTDEPSRAEPRIIERQNLTYAVIDLAKADFDEYYKGFANRVLWPTLHYRVDLAEYARNDLTGYLRVNEIFAEQVSKFIRPNDIIWVHDYHLMPLARGLRERGHTNALGFFLHVPCPPSDILLTLPRHKESIGTLKDYDLVGFQTENDRVNFGRYLENQGAQAGRDGVTFSTGDRVTRIGAFPVGIETKVFNRLARFSARTPFIAEMRESLTGRKLMIGVDRLDYSKGLADRIGGFDRFLVNYPAQRGEVTLLQITPLSRSDIQEYADMDRAVCELVGRLNGRHGEAAWTPMRYINRAYSRTLLAGLYRTASVALVTPLRDGMNLVAKEYVAAQDPENPGVLVLSQFAGAASELDAALLINPHETDALPLAILRALDMPLGERRERFQAMYSRLERNDIERWAERFLAVLTEVHRKLGLFFGLGSPAVAQESGKAHV